MYKLLTPSPDDATLIPQSSVVSTIGGYIPGAMDVAERWGRYLIPANKMYNIWQSQTMASTLFDSVRNSLVTPNPFATALSSAASAAQYIPGVSHFTKAAEICKTLHDIITGDNLVFKMLALLYQKHGEIADLQRQAVAARGAGQPLSEEAKRLAEKENEPGYVLMMAIMEVFKYHAQSLTYDQAFDLMVKLLCEAAGYLMTGGVPVLQDTSSVVCKGLLGSLFDAANVNKWENLEKSPLGQKIQEYLKTKYFNGQVNVGINAGVNALYDGLAASASGVYNRGVAAIGPSADGAASGTQPMQVASFAAADDDYLINQLEAAASPRVKPASQF